MTHQTSLKTIFEKIVKLSTQHKIDWTLLGESAFHVTFDNYRIRLTKDTFSILDKDDTLIDEHDDRLFLQAKQLDISELYELARRYALKVDEKLEQLDNLLYKKIVLDDDDFDI